MVAPMHELARKPSGRVSNFIAALVAAVVLLLAQSAAAAVPTATHEFVGLTGAWNTAANWNTNTVPDASSIVAFPTGAVVDIDADAVAQQIIVSNNMKVNCVAASATLSIDSFYLVADRLNLTSTAPTTSSCKLIAQTGGAIDAGGVARIHTVDTTEPVWSYEQVSGSALTGLYLVNVAAVIGGSQTMLVLDSSGGRDVTIASTFVNTATGGGKFNTLKVSAGASGAVFKVEASIVTKDFSFNGGASAVFTLNVTSATFVVDSIGGFSFNTMTVNLNSGAALTFGTSGIASARYNLNGDSALTMGNTMFGYQQPLTTFASTGTGNSVSLINGATMMGTPATGRSRLVLEGSGATFFAKVLEVSKLFGGADWTSITVTDTLTYSNLFDNGDTQPLQLGSNYVLGSTLTIMANNQYCAVSNATTFAIGSIACNGSPPGTLSLPYATAVTIGFGTVIVDAPLAKTVSFGGMGNTNANIGQMTLANAPETLTLLQPFSSPLLVDNTTVLFSTNNQIYGAFDCKGLPSTFKFASAGVNNVTMRGLTGTCTGANIDFGAAAASTLNINSAGGNVFPALNWGFKCASGSACAANVLAAYAPANVYPTAPDTATVTLTGAVSLRSPYNVAMTYGTTGKNLTIDTNGGLGDTGVFFVGPATASDAAKTTYLGNVVVNVPTANLEASYRVLVPLGSSLAIDGKTKFAGGGVFTLGGALAINKDIEFPTSGLQTLTSQDASATFACLNGAVSGLVSDFIGTDTFNTALNNKCVAKPISGCVAADTPAAIEYQQALTAGVALAKSCVNLAASTTVTISPALPAGLTLSYNASTSGQVFLAGTVGQAAGSQLYTLTIQNPATAAVTTTITLDIRCKAGFACIYGPPAPQEPFACAAGKDCSSNQVYTAPEDCAAGFFCATPATRAPCTTVGAYCPAGSTAQNLCPAGSFCPSATVKTDCTTQGTYCPEGSTAAAQCPAGHACPTTAASVDCAAGTYAAAGSTACADCAEGFYAATAEAAECTQCPAGFQCPTKTGTPAACVAGTYAAAAATKCTDCAAGKYSAAAEASACVSCVAGNSCTSTASTPCAAGTFAAAEATACETCAAGKYSAAVAAECTTCEAGHSCTTTTSTVCAVGKFAPAAATICNDCATGYVALSTGQSVCAACAAGSYCPNGSTQSQCAAGTYSGGTATVCVPCATGYIATTVGQTACTACAAGNACPTATAQSECAAGTFSAGAATVCAACESGYVALSTGQSVCAACAAGNACPTATAQTACAVGKFAPAAATICNDCATGYVALATGQSVCAACAAGNACPNGSTEDLCAVGKFAPAAATICNDCVAGKYANVAGASVCANCLAGYACTSSAHTACVAGTFGATAGVTACESCANGFYSAAAAATVCAACPAGSQCASKTSADACAAGTFSLAEATVCTNCNAGEYAASGASVCAACAAGSACATPAEQTTCVAGTFSAGSQTACSACAAGSIALAASASACVACEAGFACASASAAQVACAAGTFSAASATQCSACADGTYQTATQSTSCDACPAGNECSDKAAAQLCIAGTYSPGSVTVCSDCAVGTYAASSGSSSCTTCPANNACPQGASGPSACEEGWSAGEGNGVCVKDTDDIGAGRIAGIVIGAIVLVAIAGLIIYKCAVRRGSNSSSAGAPDAATASGTADVELQDQGAKTNKRSSAYADDEMPAPIDAI